MNEKEIRRYLNVIKRAVSLIEGMLDNDDGGLLESLAAVDALPPQMLQKKDVVTPNVIQPACTPVVSPEHFAARKKHIDDLLAIDCWPEAVPQFLVAKDASTDDQINRANAVLDMMLDRQISDLDFLDFGCGDGWIAQQATKRGVKSSFAYDIKASSNWGNLHGVNFTTDFQSLLNNKYDVIMLYDVLDHCHNPIDVMSQVKLLLKSNGSVFVRCHPWVSRHATHLYKQGINKSYLHLFLKHDEIKDLINQEPNFTRVEKNPIDAYRYWFEAFDIKRERFVKEPVSDFFHVQSFKELLANEQQIAVNEIDEFLKKMEIQFVDYKLQAK